MDTPILKPSNKHIKKIAAPLAVVLFITNSALAYAPQVNSIKGPSSLPAPSSSWNIPIQDPTNSLDSGFRRNDADNSTIQKILNPFGTIRNITKGSPDKTIIHIQDVHQNLSAQDNIAQALKVLIKNKKVDLVTLEGGFKTYDLTDLRNYPHRETTQAVSDYLLKTHSISGPMHTLITTEVSIPPVIGIDDKTQYDAHVEAVKISYPLKDKILNQLQAQGSDLMTQSRDVMSPELWAFHQQVQNYRTDQLSLGGYVNHLLTTHNSGLTAINIFHEAYQLEQSLNFSRVESERAILIKRLVAKMNPSDINELSSLSTAFKQGSIHHGDFYSYLKNICDDHGVSLKKFPSMRDYIQYSLLSQSIDAEELSNDIQSLEKTIYQKHATKTEEKELIIKSKQNYLTQKLVDFSLTKEEWNEYKLNPYDNVSSFQDFYQHAEDRDQSMAINLQNQINTHNANLTVLVTGGFHSKGIQDDLTKESNNATILTFVPKIEIRDTESGTEYLSIFTQEKTPLEKLFEGEKLNLSRNHLPPHQQQRGFPIMRSLYEAALERPAAQIKRIIQSKGFPFLAHLKLEGATISNFSLESLPSTTKMRPSSIFLILKKLPVVREISTLFSSPNSRSNGPINDKNEATQSNQDLKSINKNFSVHLMGRKIALSTPVFLDDLSTLTKLLARINNLSIQTIDGEQFHKSRTESYLRDGTVQAFQDKDGEYFFVSAKGIKKILGNLNDRLHNGQRIITVDMSTPRLYNPLSWKTFTDELKYFKHLQEEGFIDGITYRNAPNFGLRFTVFAKILKSIFKYIPFRWAQDLHLVLLEIDQYERPQDMEVPKNGYMATVALHYENPTAIENEIITASQKQNADILLFVKGGDRRIEDIYPWLPKMSHIETIDALRTANQLKESKQISSEIQFAATWDYKKEPRSDNGQPDLENGLKELEQKIEAGASIIYTQPPFDRGLFKIWFDEIHRRGLTDQAKFIIGVPYIPNSTALRFWYKLVGIDTRTDKIAAETLMTWKRIEKLDKRYPGKLHRFALNSNVSLINWANNHLPGQFGIHWQSIQGWRKTKTIFSLAGISPIHRLRRDQNDNSRHNMDHFIRKNLNRGSPVGYNRIIISDIESAPNKTTSYAEDTEPLLKTINRTLQYLYDTDPEARHLIQNMRLFNYRIRFSNHFRIPIDVATFSDGQYQLIINLAAYTSRKKSLDKNIQSLREDLIRTIHETIDQIKNSDSNQSLVIEPQHGFYIDSERAPHSQSKILSLLIESWKQHAKFQKYVKGKSKKKSPIGKLPDLIKIEARDIIRLVTEYDGINPVIQERSIAGSERAILLLTEIYSQLKSSPRQLQIFRSKKPIYVFKDFEPIVEAARAGIHQHYSKNTESLKNIYLEMGISFEYEQLTLREDNGRKPLHVVAVNLYDSIITDYIAKYNEKIYEVFTRAHVDEKVPKTLSNKKVLIQKEDNEDWSEFQYKDFGITEEFLTIEFSYLENGDLLEFLSSVRQQINDNTADPHTQEAVYYSFWTDFWYQIKFRGTTYQKVKSIRSLDWINGPNSEINWLVFEALKNHPQDVHVPLSTLSIQDIRSTLNSLEPGGSMYIVGLLEPTDRNHREFEGIRKTGQHLAVPNSLDLVEEMLRMEGYTVETKTMNELGAATKRTKLIKVLKSETPVEIFKWWHSFYPKSQFNQRLIKILFFAFLAKGLFILLNSSATWAFGSSLIEGYISFSSKGLLNATVGAIALSLALGVPSRVISLYLVDSPELEDISHDFMFFSQTLFIWRVISGLVALGVFTWLEIFTDNAMSRTIISSAVFLPLNFSYEIFDPLLKKWRISLKNNQYFDWKEEFYAQWDKSKIGLYGRLGPSFAMHAIINNAIPYIYRVPFSMVSDFYFMLYRSSVSYAEKINIPGRIILYVGIMFSIASGMLVSPIIGITAFYFTMVGTSSFFGKTHRDNLNGIAVVIGANLFAYSASVFGFNPGLGMVLGVILYPDVLIRLIKTENISSSELHNKEVIFSPTSTLEPHADHPIIQELLSDLGEVQTDIYDENLTSIMSYEDGTIRFSLTEDFKFNGTLTSTQLLHQLNLVYVLFRMKDYSETKSLEKMLAFYSYLEQEHPTLINEMHQDLRNSQRDRDNLFSMFLQKATGPIPDSEIASAEEGQSKAAIESQDWYSKISKVFSDKTVVYPDYLPGAGESQEDQEREQRQTWINKSIRWFLSQRNFDSPVDLERADAILNKSDIPDKDLQAAMLLDEVEGSYDYNKEEENAWRMRVKTNLNGQSLSVSRYGRASYFLTMLASASRFVIGLQEIEKILNTLESSVKDKNERAIVIRNYVTDLRILIQPDKRPTRAQLEGAIVRLRQSILNYQTEANKTIQEELRDNMNDEAKVNNLTNHQTELNKRVMVMLKQLLELEVSISQMPSERANFSVLIQRASPTGVRALNMLRLGQDPFEGGEPHIAQAYIDGGDYAYGSRDDVWLELADYWIEALPLFIHDEKMTLDDGTKITKVVIEQEGFEVAMRYVAPRFKRNIDNVMLSEHIDIARQIIDEELISEGENELQTLARGAILIEGIWFENAEAIAEIQEKFDVSRHEAIRIFIEHSNIDLEHHEIQRVKGDTTFDFDQKVTALLDPANPKHNLLKMNRLKIPTWIILTTQASGMSDAFAGQWVDESMALYNITTGFKDGNETLEEKAQKIKKEKQNEIIEIGKTIITEFQMDHLIGEYVAMGKARSENAAILQIINGYVDIAEEVAKVLMLTETLQSTDLIKNYYENFNKSLNAQSLLRVKKENPEADQKDPSFKEIYGPEIEKYMWSFARDGVIDDIGKSDKELEKRIRWYAYSPSKEHKKLPRVLRFRLAKGDTTARQETISQYHWNSNTHEILPNEDATGVQGYVPLSLAMSHPLFSYAAAGPNKKYNRGYGPSRVDLGKMEEFSTRVLSQWIGPVDHYAEEAMREFYEKYNINVRAFSDVRTGEQMKPFENAMMESSLAVTHLFIPLFQAIGNGNMLKLAAETNQRSETFIRAGASGSCGFCQPKDIYFLPFVNTVLQESVMEYAGVPIHSWNQIQKIRQGILKKVEDNIPPSAFRHRLSKAIKSTLEDKKSYLLENSPVLPPLTSIEAFGQIGMGDPKADPNRTMSTLIAAYHSPVMEALEGRIRFAPINIIHNLRSTFDYLHEMTEGETPRWEEARLAFPVEYKPVSDARLSTGLRLIEYIAGLGDYLMAAFGEEGEALAHFVVHGFDENDPVMRKYIAQNVYQRGELTPEEVELFKEIFPARAGPEDIFMFSPFRLASSAIYGALPDNKMEQNIATARNLLLPFFSNDEDQLNATILSYGSNLKKWPLYKNLLDSGKENEFYSLQNKLGGKIYLLAMDVRLNDEEYSATYGSDLWKVFEDKDIFDVTVHYEQMVGSEDEGIETNSFRHGARMIDNLPRVYATMNKNRKSASIWNDSPVQGRKTVADRIAIKQWLALGGWYTSATMSRKETEEIAAEINEERYLANQLLSAIDAEKPVDINQFKKIAQQRYEKAREEERFAKDASKWWRGGGYNNWSIRHHLYAKAWSNVLMAKSVEDIDLGTFIIIGMMHILNGRPEDEILPIIESLKSKFKYNPDDINDILYLFVKPEYQDLPNEEQLSKGESSSLKAREDDAQVAAGRAYELYLARKKANAVAERVNGYNGIVEESKDNLITYLVRAAYAKLDDGKETITNEAYGQFLAYTVAAVEKLINTSNLEPEVKEAMRQRLLVVFNKGVELSDENWVIFMGKGDDQGDIGRLAMDANGDKKRLYDIADVAGLMDAAFALMLTLEVHQISDADIERFNADGGNGFALIAHQASDGIRQFFDKTLYDHTFDYFPAWMQPSRAGTGFTNYDTIMGHWLGRGEPFSSNEVLQVAVRTHKWTRQYLDNLFRTKTMLRTKWANDPNREQYLDNLIGTYTQDEELNELGITPIGGAGNTALPVEKEWWTYTQLRELGIMEQQNLSVAAVFENFDAEEYFDLENTPVLSITAPTGRPHLTVALEQIKDYLDEYPDDPVILLLTRASDFTKFNESLSSDGKEHIEKVMTIPHAMTVVNKETFVKARSNQLGGTDNARAQAEKEADVALKRNPKGIPIAFRAKTPLVNHFSMPFHGAPYYIQGEDEAIGMPTAQAWIHNLTPGYSKGEGAAIYEAADYAPYEASWIKRLQNSDLDQAIQDIKAWVIENFSGIYRILAKPWRQSGGRGIKPSTLRDQDGNINETFLNEFSAQLAENGLRDDNVVQKMLSSSPYIWASPKYIDLVREGLAKKGISLPVGAPLFIYSRVIAIEVDNKREYVLELVVTSRMAVSNVGLGGVLYKWQTSFASSEELAQQLMQERRNSANDSMERIYERSQQVWQTIEERDEELAKEEPNFIKMEKRLNLVHRGKDGRPRDRTGRAYANPRFIMHDLIEVPIVKLPNGTEEIGPDIIDVRYDLDGNLDYFIVLDKTKGDGKWEKVRLIQDDIVGFKSMKIEDNIGYGLWQPYTENERQLEIAAAKKENRPVNTKKYGWAVRRIIHSFVKAAKQFKNSLPDGSPRFPQQPTFLTPEKNETSTVEKQEEGTSTNLLQQAFDFTRARLAKNNNEKLRPTELSMFLKGFVVKRLMENEGSIHTARYKYRNNTDGFADYVKKYSLLILEGEMKNIAKFVLQNFDGFESVDNVEDAIKLMARDVGNLVNSHFFSASFAPEIQIHPDLTSISHLVDPSQFNNIHLLVKDVSINSGIDDVYPIMANSPQSTLVLVAEPQWITTTGLVHSAYVYLNDSDKIVLARFEKGYKPDRVQMMSVAYNEIEEHRRISSIYSKLNVPLVNALSSTDEYTAGDIADDKWETFKKLENLFENGDPNIPSIDIPDTVLISHTSEPSQYEKLLEELINKHGIIFIKPRFGTNGEDVFSSESMRFGEMSRQIKRLADDGKDVIVQPDIGKEPTIRINVSMSYPEGYSADSGFAMDETTINSISNKFGNRITPEHLRLIKSAAIQAVRGINFGLSPRNQLSFAGVDIKPEFDDQNKLKNIWIIGDINVRPAGLRHARSIQTLGDTKSPTYLGLWARPPTEKDVPELLVRIAQEDINVSHIELFTLIENSDVYYEAARNLRSFLLSEFSDPKIKLKQERAIIMLGDIIWQLKKLEPAHMVLGKLNTHNTNGWRIYANALSPNEDTQKAIYNSANNQDSYQDYLDFIDPFLKAINEREIAYMQNALMELLKDLPKANSEDLRFQYPQKPTTPKKGIRIKLTNKSPSGSGLASSSAVALALLKELYEAAGLKQFVENKARLGSLGLLLENVLGLKSGRQDVDGPVYPGLKNIRYAPTHKVLEPDEPIQPLNIDLEEFSNRVLFVDSGLSRSKATNVSRGLNMRHLAYISRAPKTFLAILKSRGIHHKIVKAMETSDWPRLGKLFLDYMALRETIDPGATSSRYDFGKTKVLRQLFDPLVEEGLVYGGMFSGAMGGGSFFLVATDKGLEKVEGNKRRIDVALENLKEFKTEKNETPFNNLRELNYSINKDGVKTIIENGIIKTIGPVRVGFSSQNANDNTTSASLDGAFVANAAINLDGAPPVTVEIEPLDENVIEFVSVDRLPNAEGVISDEPKVLRLDKNNIGEFQIQDDRDPGFRMFKAALEFTGITEKHADSHNVLKDIERFMRTDENMSPAQTSGPKVFSVVPLTGIELIFTMTFGFLASISSFIKPAGNKFRINLNYVWAQSTLQRIQSLFNPHMVEIVRSPNIDLDKKIEHVTVFSDVDGVVRSDVDQPLDLKVIGETKKLINTEKAYINYISGSPTFVPTDEMWRNDRYEIGPVFSQAYNDIPEDRVRVFGSQGASEYKIQSQNDLVTHSLTSYNAHTYAGILLIAYLRYIRPRLNSEDRERATRFIFEIGFLEKPNNVGPADKNSVKKIDLILSMMRNYFSPNLQLTWRASEVELKDHWNPSFHFSELIPIVEDILENGDHNIHVYGGSNYIKISEIPKSKTVTRIKEETVIPDLKHTEQAISISIGDGGADFDMHKENDYGYHVGNKNMGEGEIDNIITAPNTYTNGTTSIITNLRKAIGKPAREWKNIFIGENKYMLDTWISMSELLVLTNGKTPEEIRENNIKFIIGLIVFGVVGTILISLAFVAFFTQPAVAAGATASIPFLIWPAKHKLTKVEKEAQRIISNLNATPLNRHISPALEGKGIVVIVDQSTKDHIDSYLSPFKDREDVTFVTGDQSLVGLIKSIVGSDANIQWTPKAFSESKYGSTLVLKKLHHGVPLQMETQVVMPKSRLIDDRGLPDTSPLRTANFVLVDVLNEIMEAVTIEFQKISEMGLLLEELINSQA